MGRGRRCPTTSAPFGSGQLPAPIHTRVPGQGRPVRPRRTRRCAACANCRLPSGLAPQIAARARRAREIRPPRLAGRPYLVRPVAPGARLGTRPEAQQALGRATSERSPQASCPAARARRRAASARANAPRLPHRSTAGGTLRVAESPQLPGERTPRTHGEHAPAHALTRAAHSQCLGPHPCAKKPQAPRTRPGPHPVHQTPTPAPAPRDWPSEAGGH